MEVTYRDGTTETVEVTQYGYGQAANQARRDGWAFDPRTTDPFGVLEGLRMACWAELMRTAAKRIPFAAWNLDVEEVATLEDEPGGSVDPTQPAQSDAQSVR
jgi:hypothetical protein